MFLFPMHSQTSKISNSQNVNNTFLASFFFGKEKPVVSCLMTGIFFIRLERFKLQQACPSLVLSMAQ